jgi:hypothetical protein
MALVRRSDITVNTVEKYPTPDGWDAFYVYQLYSRYEVIISHAGVNKGSASFKKGVWIANDHYSSKQDLEVLTREAPNGPADIRKVAKPVRDNPQPWAKVFG